MWLKNEKCRYENLCKLCLTIAYSYLGHIIPIWGISFFYDWAHLLCAFAFSYNKTNYTHYFVASEL